MNLFTRIRESVARVGASLIQTATGSPGMWLKRGDAYRSAVPWNAWQIYGGVMPGDADFEHFGPVAACQTIISQDLSRIPLRHIRVEDDGKREVVTNKAPARVFRQPNSYQVKADWVQYMMRSILSDGNSYCYAPRNERNEITAFYPLHPAITYPYLAETGEVFYQVSHDPTSVLAGVENVLWLPDRDVLHIRAATPKHPLMGESPLVAAVYPTISGTEINKHNANFFRNMGRPSGILRHPGKLKEESMKRIKERFKELTTGDKIGEVAILSEGMEWTAMTMTAVDAAVADIYKLSERQIFQIYRVPPFLAGDLDKATFSNIEELIRFYLMSGLAVWENLIEEWLTRFFALPPNERIVFDVEQALLQNDMKSRGEAYAKMIQNAVMSPNEARARENLPPVENGDEPRVQQQLVPLSYGAGLEAPDSSATSSAVPEENAQEPENLGQDEETLAYQVEMNLRAINERSRAYFPA